MSVCQHCGADAVGASGVCVVCGWRASARKTMNESDPQATRADDPAATRADATSHAPGGLRAGGSGLFAYAPRTNGPANTPTNTPGRISAATPAPVSTRYCGACGARIEPGQTFCGQCGTPVSASGVFSSGMTSVSSDSGHHMVGGYPEWDPNDRDAPTVVDAPIRGGYRAQAADSSGRALRIIVGVLCLLGSLITAIAAIVLALVTFTH